MTRRVFVICAVMGLAGLAGLGFALGYMRAVQGEAARLNADLTLAADRLDGAMARYRMLPALLARQVNMETAPPLPGLERTADTVGALGIEVMDPQGARQQTVGELRSAAILAPAAFARALGGGLGYQHTLDPNTGRRVVSFQHPIHDGAGRIAGVLALTVDFEDIESGWRGDRDVILFADAEGRIRVANRDGLALRLLRDAVTPELAQMTAGQARVIRLAAAPETDQPGRFVALVLQRPRIGMTAVGLAPLGGALRAGAVWAALIGLLGGTVLLIVQIVLQRRRALKRELTWTKTLRARLEERVSERTQALTREVAERRATEATLRRTQSDLVQAAKMSALGQMSAGISHELNQPLTAIQALAETAQMLSERGDMAQLHSNLDKIGDMAERSGRILKNFRAFARKEAPEISAVDLAQVIEDALGISQHRLAQMGVALVWQRPAWPVLVQGGRVRLQQVIVNLLSNAMDAMDGQEAPQITLDLTTSADTVRLSVADTGPGLDNPDQVFDPFYTTKPVGQGLGLGLSISYSIVDSFGGYLRARNGPCGAIFELDLKPAKGAQ
jgi:two-component system C4-dicarboxylate transport sensor histidine kinase DctB